MTLGNGDASHAPPDQDEAYAAALQALSARGRFGIRLGLSRTRALLRALGSPERSLPGALIGGTNGKGSVQALVAAVLREAGECVGQTPKPHLVSYRERVVVDGRPIPARDLASLVTEILAIADRVERRHGPPTEFELLTAIAFAWFARRGVTAAVVEVGLGGRLDATNVWDGGVAAITNVDLDHTDRLGGTIAEIAREKAAIIKRGDRAATAASREALRIIAARARRLGVPLDVVTPLPVVAMDRRGLTLQHERLGELRLGLLGRHQAGNAAVAVAVVDALRAAGIAAPDDDALRRGLVRARWPGRLELLSLQRDGQAALAPDEPVSGAPDLLLDGAHNAAGMAALAAAVDELRLQLSPGRPTVLLALMADKDVPAILAALASSAALRGASIITTEVSVRSVPAAELAAAWRQPSPGSRAQPVPDAAAALDVAIEAARADGGPLLVCGSLYLVGRVRGRLVPSPEPVA